MNTEHLREWFLYEVDRELSYRGIEIKLNLPATTLDKFVKRGRGLGANETRVFEWAKMRGYEETRQYNPII